MPWELGWKTFGREGEGTTRGLFIFSFPHRDREEGKKPKKGKVPKTGKGF